MARYAHIRNNFLLGEISPRLRGRTDLEQYSQMCEEIKNFNVLPLGGVKKRGGTRYLDDLAATTEVKLIPYYTPTENFKLAVGVGGNIQLYDMTGAPEGSPISNSMATPLMSIQYAQYGAYLFLTNGTGLPLVITWDGSTLSSFSYGEAEYKANGLGVLTADTTEAHRTQPYFPENTSATTLQINTASVGTGRTLTSSTAIFNNGMVGQYIRVRHTADIGVCKITAFTNSTNVTVSVVRAFGATSATATWSFSQWGPTFGYPRAVAFHQGRILFAGSSRFPDRLWGGQVGDIWEMADPDPTSTYQVGDADAFYSDMFDGVPSYINWLVNGKNLLTSSQAGEILVDEIDESFGIGVLNTAPTPQTSIGSAFFMPAKFENRAMFIERSQRKVYELIFSLEEDSYKPIDLNSLADHLFATGNIALTDSVAEVCWQADIKVLWARTSSYKLFSLTRDVEGGTLAWSRHVIGGSAPQGVSFTGVSWPAVVAISSVHDADYGFSELFLIVNRRINGSDVASLEKISIKDLDRYDDADSVPDYYLDCSFDDVNGSAQTTWAALAPFLLNETVHVVADGIYIGTKTLNADGDLTLDTAASFVAVGYNYESRLVTTALQSNALFGSGLGSIKRTETVTLLLDKTLSVRVGTLNEDVDSSDVDVDDLDEIQFRSETVDDLEPTPFFSGEKTIRLSATYDKHQKIIVIQNEPYPCTINGIVAKGILYD